MPYGFQRILDTGSLSLKNLNDQLEMIWKKVMGGINYRDLGGNIDEEMAKISSEGLYIECLGYDGESQTLFNGDGNGAKYFESPELKSQGRQMCKSDAVTLYVSVSGCDANDGMTSATAYRTIQRAMDTLPCIHYASTTINLVAGTYNESLGIRGLSGNLITINGNGSTLRGSLFFEGGTANIFISNLTIHQETSYGLWVRGNGLYVYFSSGGVNGNNVSGNGVIAEGGAVIVLDHSLLCNCASAAVSATLCGMIHVYSCTGTSNYMGLSAQSGGIVTGSGTAPNATVMRQETLGGKILSYGTPTNGTVPVVTAPPTVTTWSCTQTASVQNGMWRTDTNEARQGQWPVMKKSGPGHTLVATALNTGYLFFDCRDITNRLMGKTVDWAKLVIRRKIFGGNPGMVQVHLWLHNLEGTGSAPALGTDLGVLTGLGWNQTATVMLPISVGTAFKSGTAKGFALYHDSTDSSYYLSLPGVGEYAAKLVIAYR